MAERLPAMEPPLKRCKTKTGVNEKLHPTDVRRNLVCWWVLPSPYYTEYNEGSDVTVLGKNWCLRSLVFRGLDVCEWFYMLVPSDTPL